MQSTHNTISSLISIHTGNHGYNVTYSQKGMSFDSALLDASWIQLQMLQNRFCAGWGHDEMTPSYFTPLQRIGYGRRYAGRMRRMRRIVHGNRRRHGWNVPIGGIKMLYRPSADMLRNALRHY